MENLTENSSEALHNNHVPLSITLPGVSGETINTTLLLYNCYLGSEFVVNSRLIIGFRHETRTLGLKPEGGVCPICVTPSTRNR